MVMVMVQTIRFLPVHSLSLSVPIKPAGYTSDLGRRFTFGHWVVTLSDYPGTSGPQDRRRAATNGPIGCCSGSFDTSVQQHSGLDLPLAIPPQRMKEAPP